MTAFEEVERDILAYLHAHPSAMDTADGIAAWWLDPLEVSVRVVREALIHLESLRYVECCGHRGNPLYRLRVDP
jgi:hypothetical protein